MGRKIGSKNKNPLSAESRANMTAAKMGHETTHSRKIIADGVKYDTLTAAAKVYGVSIPCIHHRVNSQNPKWVGWQYI